MQEMVRKAFAFMDQMARDLEWYGDISDGIEDCMYQFDRFKEFQLCLLKDMKEQVVADIRRRITRQDMLEIIVWFYLTMTDQVAVRDSKATIIFNKVAPLERDIIYNFMGVILDHGQIKTRTLGILESLVA